MTIRYLQGVNRLFLSFFMSFAIRVVYLPHLLRYFLNVGESMWYRSFFIHPTLPFTTICSWTSFAGRYAFPFFMSLITPSGYSPPYLRYLPKKLLRRGIKKAEYSPLASPILPS